MRGGDRAGAPRRAAAEIEATGGTSLALRKELAAAAYARTAAYDAAISGWFAQQLARTSRRAWPSPAS
jgi:AICAR transformylase/IMP cyclohydrolase PurH